MGIVDEYKELKGEVDADLLAMQVGDFYEFFDEDAKIASKDLGLKMSEKSSHGQSYPMAGVPIDDLEDYVETLVMSKDYNVAIADQYEENGEHKREISRIVTPGTLVENTGGEVRYLSSIILNENRAGIAFTDLSSGEVILKEMDTDNVMDEIAVYNPVECIISTTKINTTILENVESEIKSYTSAKIQKVDKQVELDDMRDVFRDNFGKKLDDSLGLENKEFAIGAIGQLFKYLNQTNTDINRSITNIRDIEDSKYVSIDARTRYSLEITDTMGHLSEGNSLFGVMDETVTSLGREKLQKYLQKPLISHDDIEKRQESVSVIVNQGYNRKKIRNILQSYPNTQRIASKSAYGTATPRDIKKITVAIEKLNELSDLFMNNSALRKSPIYKKISSIDKEDLKKLKNLVESAIVDDPPGKIEEGIIKPEFDDELNKIVSRHEENKEWLSNHKKKIAEENNISHISIGRNKTDGFYIQVGNSEADKMPDKLRKVKNLKNSVRFKSDELSDRERDILRLEEERAEKEQEIFNSILDEITEQSQILQDLGEAISHLDAIQSFATHSVKNNWCKPEIGEKGSEINIKEGRHPVVEQNVEFNSNDAVLNDDRQFLIVTGPNMAGKSTYLRQVALICLLAQTGCYVPATSAKIGIVDGIFTRVGSVDEISQGRSTFMVEMSELANILHSATDDSLVILDEVGRGTATQDGMSIAKSTIEYIAIENGHLSPFVLFATHYHKLTDLSRTIKSVKNVHIPVRSTDDGEHRFTHSVVNGPADKSYGIEVAEMAGVPEPVIQRSYEILNDINN